MAQTSLFQECFPNIDDLDSVTDPCAFDQALRRENPSGFIGVDEAGRGPLAGPVTAAAVILPEEHGIQGLRDSKKLPEEERELLFDKIISAASGYAVAFSTVNEIEERNILQAALSAMREAVVRLKSDLPVLVDGNKVIPELANPQRALVQGDNRSATVAAASILAKVSRDRYMTEMDRKYPQYGFKHHKGYGTPGHMEKLRAYGPCEIHRKTFKGVIV